MSNEMKVIEEAGRVLAERMLDVARKSAQRQFVKWIYDRAVYAVGGTKDVDLKAKLEFHAAELKRILDNDANWRTL